MEIDVSFTLGRTLMGFLCCHPINDAWTNPRTKKKKCWEPLGPSSQNASPELIVGGSILEGGYMHFPVLLEIMTRTFESSRLMHIYNVTR